MKILSPGINKKWSIECECTGDGNGGGGCGAKLLVEDSDLFHTYSSHYDGSNKTYVTFCCDQCKVLTDIRNPIPSYVKPFKNKESMLRAKNKK